MPVVSLPTQGLINSMPATPAPTPAATEAENMAREMAGLGPMAAEEETRLGRRAGEATQRDARAEVIDTMLSDREAQAEELARSLQEAGLTEVADRFQAAARRQAFNAQRRGLAGGSAALEQQAATAAQAGQEAQQVTEQARMKAITEMMRAQQQRDRLSQEALSRDPFLAALEQAETGGVQQQTADAARLAEALRALAEAESGASAANVGAVTGILGNVGQGIGNLMSAQAVAGR